MRRPEGNGNLGGDQRAMAQKHLALPNGIPSHDTLGRLLGALQPIAFQKCFEGWIAVVAPLAEGTGLNQISVDGNVLRRSHNRKAGLGPLWVVSA